MFLGRGGWFLKYVYVRGKREEGGMEWECVFLLKNPQGHVAGLRKPAQRQGDVKKHEVPSFHSSSPFHVSHTTCSPLFTTRDAVQPFVQEA